MSKGEQHEEPQKPPSFRRRFSFMRLFKQGEGHREEAARAAVVAAVCVMLHVKIKATYVKRVVLEPKVPNIVEIRENGELQGLLLEVYLPQVKTLSKAAVHVTRRNVKVPKHFDAPLPCKVVKNPTYFCFDRTAHVLQMRFLTADQADASSEEASPSDSAETSYNIDKIMPTGNWMSPRGVLPTLEITSPQGSCHEGRDVVIKRYYLEMSAAPPRVPDGILIEARLPGSISEIKKSSLVVFPAYISVPQVFGVSLPFRVNSVPLFLHHEKATGVLRMDFRVIGPLTGYDGHDSLRRYQIYTPTCEESDTDRSLNTKYGGSVQDNLSEANSPCNRANVG